MRPSLAAYAPAGPDPTARFYNAPMAWLQLRVHTERPEFAEEILLAHGALAVSFVDAQDDPILEPAPGETPLWSRTITVGLFAENTDVAPIFASLRDVLPEAASVRTQTDLLED